MLKKKPDIYVTCICLLFVVMNKVRREGLMSIECDIEFPQHEASVFARYPEVFEHPLHFQFIQDVLRMMVGGNLALPGLSFFAATAKKSFMEGGGRDEALWDCLWATLYASLDGYAPQVAVEFGRQAVPVKLRPSFNELEAILKAVKYSDKNSRTGSDLNTREAMDEALDALFSAMDKPAAKR